MQVYNTLSRSKEPFEPLNPPKVRMYCCGPTVYNYVHIGNLRAYIFDDVLRRTIKFNGYKLTHVMNTTDEEHPESDTVESEDKMAKRADRECLTGREIARRDEDR